MINPLSRMSADALSAANMTNLAIKGIIGIQAMSEIARAVGQSDDCQHYAVRCTLAICRKISELCLLECRFCLYGKTAIASLVLGSRTFIVVIWRSQLLGIDVQSVRRPTPSYEPRERDGQSRATNGVLLCHWFCVARSMIIRRRSTRVCLPQVNRSWIIVPYL